MAEKDARRDGEGAERGAWTRRAVLSERYADSTHASTYLRWHAACEKVARRHASAVWRDVGDAITESRGVGQWRVRALRVRSPTGRKSPPTTSSSPRPRPALADFLHFGGLPRRCESSSTRCSTSSPLWPLRDCVTAVTRGVDGRAGGWWRGRMPPAVHVLTGPGARESQRTGTAEAPWELFHSHASSDDDVQRLACTRAHTYLLAVRHDSASARPTPHFLAHPLAVDRIRCTT